MKAYTGKSKIFNIMIVPCVPLVVIGLMDISSFTDTCAMIGGVYFVLLLIIWKVVHPLFPLFAEMYIENDAICKRVIWFTTQRIPREKIYTSYYYSRGIIYVIISSVPIPSTEKEKILLIKSPKAILFPWEPQMNYDFPDIFDGTDWV